MLRFLAACGENAGNAGDGCGGGDGGENGCAGGGWRRAATGEEMRSLLAVGAFHKGTGPGEIGPVLGSREGITGAACGPVVPAGAGAESGRATCSGEEMLRVVSASPGSGLLLLRAGLVGSE